MKKLIVTGTLALGLAAMLQQEASAWVSSRFHIGLGWERAAAGNSILWGAWRNNHPGVSYDAHFDPHLPPPPPPPVIMPPAHINVVPAPPVVVPAPSIVVPAPSHGQHAYNYNYNYGYQTQPYAYGSPSYVPYAGYGYADGGRYGSPFQVATYPRPSYYYPNSWYQR